MIKMIGITWVIQQWAILYIEYNLSSDYNLVL